MRYTCLLKYNINFDKSNAQLIVMLSMQMMYSMNRYLKLSWLGQRVSTRVRNQFLPVYHRLSKNSSVVLKMYQTDVHIYFSILYWANTKSATNCLLFVPAPEAMWLIMEFCRLPTDGG